MPAVDDPFSIAASLPGQMATMRGQIKDLSVNNTQALSRALAAATASAASASAAATALQASVVTPVTAVATNLGATVLPFNVTATMVVPAGATRCFYTATASVYGYSSGSFQVGFQINAPSTGSFGYLAASAAPLASSGISVATGFLTALTPGSILSFNTYVGSPYSGSGYSLDTKVQVLAVFQP